MRHFISAQSERLGNRNFFAQPAEHHSYLRQSPGKLIKGRSGEKFQVAGHDAIVFKPVRKPYSDVERMRKLLWMLLAASLGDNRWNIDTCLSHHIPEAENLITRKVIRDPVRVKRQLVGLLPNAKFSKVLHMNIKDSYQSSVTSFQFPCFYRQLKTAYWKLF